MKKCIAVLSVITILSGCGSDSDKPNPMTSGRRAPMLNQGGAMPPSMFPPMGQPAPYGVPSMPPMGMEEPGMMPPMMGDDSSMPMPPPPPPGYGGAPMDSPYAAAPAPYTGGEALPSGRRAPKLNNMQIAVAPAPIPPAYSPQPIMPAPYQPIVVKPEAEQDYNTAMIPPPPPPPSAQELAAKTSVDVLKPLGGRDISDLEVELNAPTASNPPKVIVPVSSSSPSTNYQDLKPLHESSQAESPASVTVNIQPPVQSGSGNRVDSKGYPVLAEIPPAPPKPIPVEQDSRVVELRQDYSNSTSQNNFNAGDIPPPPPPMPNFNAPQGSNPAVASTNFEDLKPLEVPASTPPKITVPVTVPQSVSVNEPPQYVAPTSLEAQPQNELMPQGPTVVIRSKKSPKPLHTSQDEAPQPVQIQAQPMENLPSTNVADLRSATSNEPTIPQYEATPVVSLAAAPSFTVTSEWASTNVADLHPISSSSASFRPVLAQSRYSAIRAQARNSVRY